MNREHEARLVVLVADGSESRREAIAKAIQRLGHDVVARESSLAEIARITVMEHPDVAIVVVNEAGEHALKLIDRIVHEATCPVIAVLDVEDRAFVREAAKRGIFAYIAGDESDELQSPIDIVLRRFAEYHNLEAAFGRRAITERAKGILMERHGIDEDEAFAMLRDHARRHGLKRVDVAQSIASVRALLPQSSSEERVGESPGEI
jgi:response regulator NasT